MSSLPDTLEQLEATIVEVEKTLSPLFSQPLPDLLAKLSPIERCKLQAFVAYSINTLFFIYIKLNGISPRRHKIMSELQRVQAYIKKINNAEGKKEQRRLAVNKEAAGRFIKHGISSNQKSNESGSKD